MLLLPHALPALLVLALLPGHAHATDEIIPWPSGWSIEVVASDTRTPAQPDSPRLRQRATKYDVNDQPEMVMELTQSELLPDHAVNLPGVLLTMRKAIQVDFMRSGFMSVCSTFGQTYLGEMPALRTTCTVTQNGVPVMKQTLVVTASAHKAWSISYAGSTDGYAALEPEVTTFLQTLKLG